MAKPFTPDEAQRAKESSVPDEVFDVVNEILGREFSGRGSVIIKQDDIVDALVEKGIARNDIFKNHMLDFEPHYRRAGWSVEYDRPGYNESYPACYKFEKKKVDNRELQ